jgi:phosphatidylglycerophosphate synthase
VAFVLLPDRTARIVIVLLAGASDIFDGRVARRFGPSRLGAFIDPVVDKLFMASAFGVVLVAGGLQWYEVVGVLLRDIVATAAFVVTAARRRPASIPARAGGKAVTIGQGLTLLGFLLGWAATRPLAWATAAVSLYAILDYYRAAPTERRPVG